VRFWTTVFGLARRKFVGPPVALAAIGLALAAYFLVPSRYVSTASMVLTVPATGGTLETEPQQKPGLTNPLLQFNDALRTTAGILILATNTPEVAAEVGVKEGGPTSLTINDGRTNPDLLGISTNGPFVYVEVESTSPDTVRDIMRKAQLRIRIELARRQTALDAPVSTHIGILDVMPASVPKPVVQDRLLAVAGGALLGVVGGLAVAYGVQRVRSARQATALLPEALPESAAPLLPEPQPEEEAWAVAVAEQPGEEAETGDADAAGDDAGQTRESEAAEASGTEPRNGTKPQVRALSVYPLKVPANLADDDTRPIQAINVDDD
jgi:hypothetical protein